MTTPPNIEEQVDKIRTMLADRNLRYIARAAGLHYNTLYNVLKGKTPSLTTLSKLNAYLFGK